MRNNIRDYEAVENVARKFAEAVAKVYNQNSDTIKK